MRIAHYQESGVAWVPWRIQRLLEGEEDLVVKLFTPPRGALEDYGLGGELRKCLGHADIPECDVVHVHHNILWRKYGRLLRSKIPKAKMVVSIHGTPDREHIPNAGLVEPNGPLPDAYHVVEPGLRDIVQAWNPGVPIHVIPNHHARADIGDLRKGRMTGGRAIPIEVMPTPIGSTPSSGGGFRVFDDDGKEIKPKAKQSIKPVVLPADPDPKSEFLLRPKERAEAIMEERGLDELPSYHHSIYAPYSHVARFKDGELRDKAFILLVGDYQWKVKVDPMRISNDELIRELYQHDACWVQCQGYIDILTTECWSTGCVPIVAPPSGSKVEELKQIMGGSPPFLDWSEGLKSAAKDLAENLESYRRLGADFMTECWTLERARSLWADFYRSL